MQNRDEFLANRKKIIGGTDIAAILGLSNFKSPVDVYLEKTGRAVDKEMGLPAQIGTYMEDFVCQKYEEKEGRLTQRYKKQIIHPVYSFLGGNVDRLVIPEGEKVAHHMGDIRTNRGMEAKAVGGFTGNQWGDENSDEVPTAYWVQCQWYMGLHPSFKFWDLAAVIGNHRFAVYQYSRDQSVINDLQARGIEFWNNHVLSDVAPPPQSAADVSALYPRSEEGKKVAATDEIMEKVEAAIKAREARDKAHAEYEQSKIPVSAFMENAQILVDSNGKPIVTWKNNKDSKVFDYESAFHEAMRKIEISNVLEPMEIFAMQKQLIAKHSNTKIGERKFLIK